MERFHSVMHSECGSMIQNIFTWVPECLHLNYTNTKEKLELAKEKAERYSTVNWSFVPASDLSN
jgi:hypothetical protein